MTYNFFRRFKSRLQIHFLGLAVLATGGCGYHFQNSHNVLFEKEGIRKVYITPLSNETFKPGVENVVYSNLIRTLMAHRRVKVVQDIEDADAVLSGSVSGASYSSSGGTQVRGLNPTTVGSQLPTAGAGISTEYLAVLSCGFSLIRKDTPPGKSSALWASSFSRSKSFPAANQLDVPGTTSALINESEFDRALSDLARSMMEDVHESMLAMF